MSTIETKVKIETAHITPAHAAELQALFAASPSPVICDRSAGNVLMWTGELQTELVTADGHVAVAEHCGKNLCFSPASGAPDAVPTVRALLDAYGTPLRLCPIGEDEKAPLAAAFGDRIRFGANDGAADYIYDAADLRQFRGKSYHTQKNHVNAFLREHPDYRFEPLTAESEAALAAFFDAYTAADDDDSASAKEEIAACRRILPLLGALPLDTRLLTDGGRILGFTVMERIGDTLMIHIEKGLPAVRGVYPMLVTLEANAYPDVRFVNREEDDGNEGLRRSKQSYHPVRLLQKYYAEIV